MSSPVRFLLCGKHPGHLQACVTKVQPEFEVIRKASSVEDAKAAVEEFLTSESTPKISAIVMGGGFSKTDFEAVWPSAKSVPWLRPIQTSPDYSGPTITEAPSADAVATRLRKGLDQHLEELKQQKGAGEVWYF